MKQVDRHGPFDFERATPDVLACELERRILTVCGYLEKLRSLKRYAGRVPEVSKAIALYAKEAVRGDMLPPTKTGDHGKIGHHQRWPGTRDTHRRRGG